jgi:hypothetical protein
MLPFSHLVDMLLDRFWVHVGRRAPTPRRHTRHVAAHGSHLAHGTEQRAQPGGQERWADPTAETPMRPLCAPSCAFLNGERARRRGVSSSRSSRRQVDNPCSAVALRPTGRYDSHRRPVAARRLSSAPRAAAVLGAPRGGGASASGLWARLCVLWDDLYGSFRPAGPGGRADSD